MKANLKSARVTKDKANLRIGLLLALAVIMFVNLPSIEVHAQGTTISNLLYPERVIVGDSATIHADFTFHDSVRGYYMEVSLFDIDTQTLAVGSATTTPGSCELGPINAFVNGLLPSLAGQAACYVNLSSSSGVEHATFLINFPARGMRHLKVQASLIFPPPISYNVDSEFTISVTDQLALTINTPSQVAVSLDGVPQPTGSVGVVVRIGTHTIVVPSVVQVDNSTRLRFESWSDGSTATTRTLNLQDNTTLTANYITQHRLKLVSDRANATGSGWYDSGTLVSFSVPSRYDVIWVFQGWYEDTSLVTSSNSGSIQLNAPHTLVSRWGLDYLLVGSIIGVIVGIGFCLAYVGKRLPFLTKPSRKRTRGRQAKLNDIVSERTIYLAPISETKPTEKSVEPKANDKPTLTCSQCGAKITWDSKFCKECGTQQR